MTKVLDKQCIFDLVLQETGGINNSARVLRDNGLNFNYSLPAGEDVSVGLTESLKIVSNYELKKFKPNNAEIIIEVPPWILEFGEWNGAGIWTADGEWKTV
jgi:hypothetical protein